MPFDPNKPGESNEVDCLRYIANKAGGSAPSGAAGGDLSGTYPNPAVAHAPAAGITGPTLASNVVSSSLQTAGALDATSLTSDTFVKMKGSVTGSISLVSPASVAGDYVITITGVGTGIVTLPASTFTAARIDSGQAFIGQNTFAGGSVIILAAQQAGNGNFNTGTVQIQGGLYVNGLIFANGAFQMDADSYFYWMGRSQLGSSANGTITLTNAAQNGFAGLLLGPSGTGYSRLKPSGTGGLTTFRLADDSADAPIAVSSVKAPIIDVTGIQTSAGAAGTIYKGAANALFVSP